MEIREIQRDELPQLLALYRHLHPDGWLEEGPDAQKIWQAIQAAPGYHIVVAEEGGELVSTCTLLIVPNLTHLGRPYGLIESVVTHPAHRLPEFCPAAGPGAGLLQADADDRQQAAIHPALLRKGGLPLGCKDGLPSVAVTKQASLLGRLDSYPLERETAWRTLCRFLLPHPTCRPFSSARRRPRSAAWVLSSRWIV